ncbi:unnamed protein product [Rhizoctonia solani]|uniref:Uncharacterized protein n=1 Tax=Rhizoctonia solani TaxID=456999 RepID=A0A8H3DW44_9AGAM|nr:unnamed protein product [Rhizoctonia solani]
MSSVPAPYTLNAKTPTEFDRFAPVHYVKIDGDLASALALGTEDGYIHWRSSRYNGLSELWRMGCGTVIRAVGLDSELDGVSHRQWIFPT